ncbi:MAG: hypothetical protein ACOCVF_01220 [bacterium]
MDDFLKIKQNSMETLGFWTEEFKSVIIHMVERNYTIRIIQTWYIEDLIFNEEKILIKWKKRLEPLTKKELKEKGFFIDSME